eukprot:XP_027319959.1 uncharacterized protein LOC101804221 isoform X3 [Anas platyrhynchos]
MGAPRGGAQQHPWVRAGTPRPPRATCRAWRENGAWRRDVSNAESGNAEVARRKCPRLPWFKSSMVKECIHAILKEKLADAQYVPEEVPQLTKSLSEIIKDRLKDGNKARWEQ